MLGTDGKKESRKYVLSARLDYIYIYIYIHEQDETQGQFLSGF